MKRLAASFALAGRDRGFKRRDRGAALLASVRSYREAMRAFAGQGDLEVWYARLDVEEQLGRVEEIDPGSVKRFERGIAKARTKDSVRAMERLTEVVDGEIRIVNQPPLIVPIEELVAPAEASGSRRRCAMSSPPIARPCPVTASTSSTATASATSPTRWSGSGASGRVPGWSC